MEIEFVKNYRFAHNGTTVVEYTKGQAVDTSAMADGARLRECAFADKAASESFRAKAAAKAQAEAEAQMKADAEKAEAEAQMKADAEKAETQRLKDEADAKAKAETQRLKDEADAKAKAEAEAKKGGKK